MIIEHVAIYVNDLEENKKVIDLLDLIFTKKDNYINEFV